MLRQLNDIVISLLAFVLGINYCLFAWLSYDIIGLNGEFMYSARTIWGVIQTVLGCLMLAFLFLRRITHVVHKYWTVIMAIVFVMQLPIASLWYMTLMREPLSALLGVILHTMLIGLIAADYLTVNKSSRNDGQHTVINDDDKDIKLDT